VVYRNSYAPRQAELLESAPALRAAAQANDKARLEALERSLGITQPSSSSSSSTPNEAMKRSASDVDLEELAMKKHKFEDNQFFEESREIKDNVRSAVAAGSFYPFPKISTGRVVLISLIIGLLKKKKKPKTDGVEPIVQGKGKAKALPVEGMTKAVKDKMAMPPPPTTAAATAVA
jgi:hypothetical protein